MRIERGIPASAMSIKPRQDQILRRGYDSEHTSSLGAHRNLASPGLAVDGTHLESLVQSRVRDNSSADQEPENTAEKHYNKHGGNLQVWTMRRAEQQPQVRLSHLGSRNVGDMDLACERHHVMLAKAVKVDVLHQDHLVVVLLKDGSIHNSRQVLAVSFCAC